MLVSKCGETSMTACALEMPLNEPQPRTEVILEGPMGEAFGRVWNLCINSPREALNLIDVNKPGVLIWIRNNLKKYSHYRVLVTYEDGREEALNKDDYPLLRKMKQIRFVPLVEGASAGARIVAGIILLIVAWWNPYSWAYAASATGTAFTAAGSAAISIGASLVIGGIVQKLNEPGSADNASERKDKTSFFFDGPVNTTTQGVPVPLIYGRCLVGSHAVSASLTIDDITMYQRRSASVSYNGSFTYSDQTYTLEQLEEGVVYRNLQTGQHGMMIAGVWTAVQ
jgi:predicted phage tail protein